VVSGQDGPGILQGHSLAHIKERVTEQAIQRLQHKERSAEAEIRQLRRQVEEFRNQQAELSGRVADFELFMNKLRSSLPFRVHRKARHWLRPGFRSDGPHHLEVSPECRPLDTVLPQKPT
jgi:hypothetical protein